MSVLYVLNSDLYNELLCVNSRQTILGRTSIFHSGMHSSGLIFSIIVSYFNANACTINMLVVTDFKSSNCAHDQSWNLLYTCDLGEESGRGECSDYMCATD